MSSYLISKESGEIKIPSEMYPVKGNECRIFNHSNTEEVTDPKVIEIFNSIETPELANIVSEELTKKLKEAGYPAEMYFGWYDVDAFPVPLPHVFVVLENHVLDLYISKEKAYREAFQDKMKEFDLESYIKDIPNKVSEFFSRFSDKELEDFYNSAGEDAFCNSIDEDVNNFFDPAEIVNNMAQSINNEIYITGKVDMGSAYIGAPADNAWVKNTLEDLTEKFPDHPAFIRPDQSVVYED